MALMPALGDPEGHRVPAGTQVIDAHVHLFPDRLFSAIWRWFDEYGWPIRYRLQAEEAVEFLTSRGIEKIVALVYAHKDGVASSLNEFIADMARRHPEVIPVGTVQPGEAGAREILEHALGPLGLRGIKIHCHVQCVAPDSPGMDTIFETAAAFDVPLVIHAGREPASPGYQCDPHELCSADAMATMLKRHPDVTVVVPHFGADEIADYERLLGDHPNLLLDTTMMMADYFPVRAREGLLQEHSSRILYGTDFPNLPYAWDRELSRILALELPDEARADILRNNALRVFKAG